MGRPLLPIDENQVEELAAINCTNEEIASVLRCSKDTIEGRFSAAVKRGREYGKSSLKRMMWAKCKEGNITMMIWLSKQMLDYHDRFQHNIEDLKRIQMMKQIEAESYLNLEDLSGTTNSRNMDQNIQEIDAKEVSTH